MEKTGKNKKIQIMKKNKSSILLKKKTFMKSKT